MAAENPLGLRTEGEIIRAAFQRPPFDSRRSSVTWRVKDLIVRGFESDLLAVSAAGYVTEGEIKLTKSDFTAEFDHKARKHRLLQKRWDQLQAKPTIKEAKTPPVVRGARPGPLFTSLVQWVLVVPPNLGDILAANHCELLPPYASLLVFRSPTCAEMVRSVRFVRVEPNSGHREMVIENVYHKTLSAIYNSRYRL